MTLSTAGLVRITIRAPRRRVDLSVPHLVPLAEILPEVVVRAGEALPDAEVAAGGWVLRRGDGARLAGHEGLSSQGVGDGAVLYLVPGHVSWPEPRYDDLVEEIADVAREQTPMWTAAATRVVAAVGAGLALLTGVAGLWSGGAHRTGPAAAAVAIVLVLVATGAGLARFKGDQLAGVVAGAGALAYSCLAGALLVAAGSSPGLPAGNAGSVPEQMLAASAALLVTSVVGGLAIGCGLRIFVAGLTVGVGGSIAALSRSVVTVPQAAAILTVAVVAGVGTAPWLAVRLGRLPFPLLSADPDVLAKEQRPVRAAVRAAVTRADSVLAGLLLGLSVLGAGCVVVLGAAPGPAAPVLALLASVALLMRARLFPAVWARVPLLAAGGAGICLAGAQRLVIDGPVAGTAVAAGGLLVALGLLATGAASAGTAPGPGRLYLGRVADLLDVAALVALAPVACAVLDLYGWVGGLAS